MINFLFNPLINLFNQIKFKTKIILISIALIVPLLFPTYTFIQTQFEKKEDIKLSTIGLKYNRYIYELIILIAEHRGLLNGYDGKKNNTRKAILQIEKDADKLINEYITFDKKNLNILTNNDYLKLTYNLEILKIENLPSNFDKSKIFKKHSKLINDIISNRQIRLEKTHFYSKEVQQLNSLSNILSYQLPTLTELVGKLRGLGTKIFLEKKLTEIQEQQIIGLLATVNEHLNTLKDNKLLYKNNTYIQLNKQTIKLIKEFAKLKILLQNNLLNNQDFSINPKDFYKQATLTIKKIHQYYDILEDLYLKIVNKKENEINKKLIYAIGGILAILLISSHLLIALYASIHNSLDKLKEVSKNLSVGNYDENITHNGKDEIAEAIKTFNRLSIRLKKTLTFLDNYKFAIDNTSIVSKTDKKGIITYVNKQFCQISGYSEKELLGKPHNIVRHPDMPKEAFKDMWDTIKSGKTWKGLVKNKKKNGDYYIVDATIIPMYDNNGNLVEYVAVRHDVTELEKQKEAQLYDKLTSLPKREILLEDIQKKDKPILLILNINDFSSLNKFYGYEIADKVLLFLAELLPKLFKNIGGKVYKLHADEFAVLFEGEGFTKRSLYDLILNYINIIESSDIECDNTSCINISLHCGLAMCDDEENTNLQLNADLALKRAKKEHKKLIIFNAQKDNQNSYINNISWIKKIEKAIKEDRIVPFFQPIIDNRSETIRKYECLVRMIDEDGKVISPFFFLDIAKKANLYYKITRIMIEKSFKKFEKYPNLEFSVNLSIEDIQHKDTINFIIEKIKSCKNPNRVIFEIVESEEITDYNDITTFIEDVKRYGVKIAIDDFGSGFSSFEHILNINPDFIKIDGSIVKNIDTNENAKIITNAIIAFSHKLNLEVIAEYIHSQTIQDMVCEMWCDYSQGFFIGEPSQTLKGIEDILTKEKEEKLETA